MPCGIRLNASSGSLRSGPNSWRAPDFGIARFGTHTGCLSFSYPAEPTLSPLTSLLSAIADLCETPAGQRDEASDYTLVQLVCPFTMPTR